MFTPGKGSIEVWRWTKQSQLIPVMAVLLLAHLPLPCYDADGENRGVVTKGLTDPAAWHVMFLGIQPERDIDRGPFSSDPRHQHRGGSVFDAPYIAAAQVLAPESAGMARLALALSPATSSVCAERLRASMYDLGIARTFSCSYSMHSPQAWRRRLCLMLI